MERVKVLESHLAGGKSLRHVVAGRPEGILRSVEETIGRTPLVKLNRIIGTANSVVAIKMETENPCKSIKDRLGLALVIDAEKKGLIVPGRTTLIEATSGNTGIALAMVGAAKGYKVVLTMPETMSLERRMVLRAYGARVVLTPSELGLAGSQAKAREILEELQGEGEEGFITQQFDSPSNAMVHRTTTAPEIWEACGGNVDYVVMGVGTGGTITGIAQFFKEKNSKCKFVAVEPAESPCLTHKQSRSDPFVPLPHRIEGIGAGFLPNVLDLALLDEVVTVSSEDAIDMARRMPREEGLLVGISTGAIVHAARTLAHRPENRGKTIVCIAPSHGERYLTSPLFSNLRTQCTEQAVVPVPETPTLEPPRHIPTSGGYPRLARTGTVLPSVLFSIGNTPMVSLNRVAHGLPGRVVVKLEAENPGRSVKDRLALGLIHDAQEAGMITPGRSTLIEATSGNTGIALSMLGAAMGYKVVLTMPETMSIERRVVMRAYGAELVLTPASKGLLGARWKAQQIAKSINAKKDGHTALLMEQFENQSNSRVHYETTAAEIWNDTAGKVDIVVCGMGTGGTITGIARFLKERKRCQVVGVEPTESPAVTASLQGKPFTPAPHGIQGIGPGFVPRVLDSSLVDEIVTVSTSEAVEMTHRLPKDEGLFMGISSGAVVKAARDLAALPQNAGKLIVAVLPDFGERYLSSPFFADLQEECRELTVVAPKAVVPSGSQAPNASFVWARLREEAKRACAKEPMLQGFFYSRVLHQASMATALADCLSSALHRPSNQGVDLVKAAVTTLEANPGIIEDCAVDLWRYGQIDAALASDPFPYLTPFLLYKGFHAIVCHRIAHSKWTAGETWLASLFQSCSSAAFAVDIHPAARIGPGITVDHATGLVIGGTAVVGKNVQFLHDITLGATGKEQGDRHPKIGNDVVLGAHCQVLGNIKVGDGVVVAASAVVNRAVDPYCTVAGVPAKVVKRAPVPRLASFYDPKI